MTDWVVYECDLGHRWEVEGAPEVEAPQCPFGHDAVIEHRLAGADRAILTLIPAARIADPVTGQVAREGDYFIGIAERGRGEMLRSAQPYSWDDATRRLSELRGLSWEEAHRRWRRMGLGGRQSR
jgi:hypothetical protein